MPPTGVLIVTAVDKAILTIAGRYNHGELRVSDPQARQQQVVAGLGMDPLYFAPGVNSNPLVASSNPLDIARWIILGFYDQSTVHRIWKFAVALEKAGRISERTASDIRRRARPERQAVFVTTDTGRIATWYRGLDDTDRFTDEFLTYPQETVRDYALMSGETVSLGRKLRHDVRVAVRRSK
jgi:hypothetical protein